jgi:hypothetical protein
MSYLPSYAAAFRCIGQELQSQNIEVFELKSHAGEFRLQCGDQNPPYTGLVEMLFSKEKIQMIDREGEDGGVSRPVRYDSTAFPKYFAQWGNTSTEKAATCVGLTTAVLRLTRLWISNIKPELDKSRWKP